MKEGLHPHRECALTPACPGSWLLRSLQLSSLLRPEGWDEPKPLGGTMLDQTSLWFLAPFGWEMQPRWARGCPPLQDSGCRSPLGYMLTMPWALCVSLTGRVSISLSLPAAQGG